MFVPLSESFRSHCLSFEIPLLGVLAHDTCECQWPPLLQTSPRCVQGGGIRPHLRLAWHARLRQISGPSAIVKPLILACAAKLCDVTTWCFHALPRLNYGQRFLQLTASPFRHSPSLAYPFYKLCGPVVKDEHKRCSLDACSKTTS